METLWETYENSYNHISALEWRIFKNRRKVCNDYGKLCGSLNTTALDNSYVIKAEVKYKKDGSKYVRVSIK